MHVFFRATSVALVLTAALSGRAAAQSGQKFAYIKSSVLLEQAPGRAEAQAQLDRETGAFRDEIKRMNDSLTTMVSAFEKVAATLSAAAREARTKDLQARQADYQRRMQGLEAKAQQRQDELVTPVYDRVKLAIEDIRVEGGYSFIFNYDQGSPIMAADKNLDVTDRVVARLRSAAAAGPARPATGAPAAAPAGVTRPATPPLD